MSSSSESILDHIADYLTFISDAQSFWFIERALEFIPHNVVILVGCEVDEDAPPPVCNEDNDDLDASNLHWQLSRRRHPRTSLADLKMVVNAIPREGGVGGIIAGGGQERGQRRRYQ